MKKFYKLNLRYILELFLVWNCFLIGISWLSPKIMPPRNFLTYFKSEDKNNQFFWNRANFDGGHYLAINRFGYGLKQQSFFPTYPNLIKNISSFTDEKDLIVGVGISSTSFLLALLFFYKLIMVDYDKKIAKRALLFWIIFPTSFFFGCVYTESLFMFFVLASFYFARKNKWLLAGILGALASSTRPVGIFLFPALLYEWWEQAKIRNSKFEIRNLILILIVPLGLLSYMRYLQINFSDPMMFIHNQKFFGAERTGGQIILLYQVFWRYFKMILTTRFDILYFTVWLELATAVGFIYLLVEAFRKKIRTSYLIFSLMAFITPTLTGTFSSLPRYVLTLFPCFILLGMLKQKQIRVGIILFFTLLAILCTALFFNGYWIA